MTPLWPPLGAMMPRIEADFLISLLYLLFGTSYLPDVQQLTKIHNFSVDTSNTVGSYVYRDKDIF